MGYRDFEHKQRFSIMDFTEDLESVKSFISKVDHVSHMASGAKHNFDFPEDVQGGLS